MREMLRLCGVLLFCALLAACSAQRSKGIDQLIAPAAAQSGAAAAATPAGGQLTIGLVMKTLTNPFFVKMEQGARRAQAELGVSLIVKTGAKETSIDQQIAIVDEMIQAKVDAIVIAPGSSTELIPVLKKARAAGIPIINIDNQLDPTMSRQMGLNDVPFISVDNEQGAYLSAKTISDKVTAATDAVIIEGIRDAKNAQDRKAGAERAFAENKNLHLVASETANWKIDEAHDVTSRLFASYPAIKVIFCANDMMALGALRFLEETNRHDVQVAGFDALDEALPAVRSGQLAATIDQQADVQGYTGVQYAVRAIRGEKLPATTMVDVRLVTTSTLK